MIKGGEGEADVIQRQARSKTQLKKTEARSDHRQDGLFSNPQVFIRLTRKFGQSLKRE